MHWALAEELVRTRAEEARGAAVGRRFGRTDRTVKAHAGDEIVIRRSAPGDGYALTTLAALDEHAWCGGPTLIAEVDSSIRAAYPLDGSEPFADPFYETAELVALLEVRAAQLGRPGAPVKQRRSRFRPSWGQVR